MTRAVDASTANSLARAGELPRLRDALAVERGLGVVVSAPLMEWAAAALSQTGATVIALDPASAIPQRAERPRAPAEG